MFRIPYHDLPVGVGRDFVFEIPADFFSHWPEAEVGEVAVPDSEVSVHALRRSTTLLELSVRINAEVTLTCDRCLDEFLCPVYFVGHPVVKISDSVPEGERYSGDANVEANNSDGDILWISTAEEAIDLGQYVYESIMLALPFQRVHPEMKDCNQDMLRRFRIVSEEEFETLTGEERPDADTDTGGEGNPFAKALAGLKDKTDDNDK